MADPEGPATTNSTPTKTSSTTVVVPGTALLNRQGSPMKYAITYDLDDEAAS